MSHSHVVFDGYSYEPPTYEEAQANGPLNQSVYKPTVSQDINFVGGLRPLYTPNGYNGLNEYNRAKRRRRMRIAAATAIGVLGVIIFIAVLFWKINLNNYHASQSYKSFDDDMNENLESYSSYNRGSSRYNNNDYYREPMIENEQVQQSNDNALHKTEIDDNMSHENPSANNANNFGLPVDAREIFEQMKKEDFTDDSAQAKEEDLDFASKDPEKLFDNIDAFLKSKIERLHLNSVESTSNNPTNTTRKDNVNDTGEEKVTSPNANPSKPYNYFDGLLVREIGKLEPFASSSTTENSRLYSSLDAKLQNLFNPQTGEIYEDKVQAYVRGLLVQGKRKK